MKAHLQCDNPMHSFLFTLNKGKDKSMAKKNLRMLLSLLLIFTMVFSGVVTVHAADDTIEVGIDVTYGQTEARAMLKRVNDFRANVHTSGDFAGDQAWYWNSDNSTRRVFGTGELQPYTYDYGLEKIAMLRAAEASVLFDHQRPNGKDCFTAGNFGGENIAAGQRTEEAAFVSWREDEYMFSGQGHRRAMLSPSFTHIGIGHAIGSNGVHYWTQAFKSGALGGADEGAVDGKETVQIEILTSMITSGEFSTDPEKLVVIKEETIEVPVGTYRILMSETWPQRAVPTTPNLTWSVEDTTIASLSATDGKVKGTKIGETNLVTTLKGTTYKVPVTVKGISSVEALSDITVDSGTAPTLPTKVKATWSDQTKSEETVTWDEIPDAYKNRNGGTFTVQGTVKGYDNKVSQKVIVNPATITKVEISPKEETVESGSGPELIPEKATVTWSNGDTSNETITWNEIQESDYTKREGGTSTISGKITTTNPTEERSVEYTIKVNPATVAAVAEPKALEVFTTTTGVQGKLPKKVTVTWSDGDPTTSEDVTWSDAKDQYTEAGTFTVNGKTIKDAAATMQVIVKEPTVTGISWKKDPKTTYVINQEYQNDGEIVVSYDDGLTKDVKVTPDMVTGFSTKEKNPKIELTVTYTERTVTKELKYDIEVIERYVTECTFDFTNVEKEYIEETEISAAGGKIHLVYNDGFEEDVDLKVDMLSGYDMNKIGNQTVTATYTDKAVDQDFTDTYEINVREKQVEKISVKPTPKTSYIEKQDLDLDTFTIKVDYDNGTTEDLPVTQDMVSGYDKTKIGPQTVTITHEGKTTTVNVLVREKQVEKIAVEEPITSSVYEGKELNLSGDSILVTYDNGDEETVSLDKAEVTGFDSTKDYAEETVVPLTATYQGKTDTFNVTVRAITGVEKLNEITVDSGEMPELPETVTVNWSDNTKSTEDVSWDQVSDTYKDRKGGSFTVQGTVDYFDKKAEQPVKVNPATIEKTVFSPEEETVDSGTAPSKMPKTATVTWSNGDQSEEEITWGEIRKEQYTLRQGGNVTISGTITTSEPTAKEEVAYRITVKPATVASVEEPKALDVFTTTKGVAGQLPATVNVTWSDGDPTTEESVTWTDAKDQYTEEGTFTVNGTTILDAPVTMKVNAKEPAVVSVGWNNRPEKTYYVVGQSIKDTDDLGELAVIYEDGQTKLVKPTKDMISGFDSSQEAQDQELTVTYTEKGKDYPAKYTVDIVPRQVVSVEAKYDGPTEIVAGTELDPSKVYIEKKYNDDTTETTPVEEANVYLPNTSSIKLQTVLENGKEVANIRAEHEGRVHDIPITIVPVNYIMSEGDGSTYTKGNHEILSFTSTADFGKFVQVMVDGSVLDKAKYKSEEGSTKITFFNAYSEGLKVGKHTIAIVSNDGKVDGTFTVKAAEATKKDESKNSQTPLTGDTGAPEAYIFLAIGALGLIAAIKRKAV